MADTIYRNSTRLQARGYFGRKQADAFCQNLLANRAWNDARKGGRVVNLERYGDDDRARISLTYQTSFVSEWNQKGAWTQVLGSSSYFVEIPPEGFRGSVGGLSFQNGSLNADSLFMTATPVLGANKPFTIRFRILKPDSEQKGTFWYCGFGVWRFEVRDGNASVYRLTEQWSESREGQWRALQALSEPNAAQSTMRDELKSLIFADERDLSLVGSEGWYEGAHEVTFLPDSRGVFSVVVEGQGAENGVDVEDTRITQTRAQGVLWPESRVTVSSNGGAYAWQLGRPTYARAGTYSLGTFNAIAGLDASDIEVSVRGDLNGGTATGQCVEVNVAKWQIVLTLSGDGASSPVIYAAEAFEEGGERSGSDTVVFDTDNLAAHVIEDIQPTWDEENRRTEVQVVIRNIDGQINVNSGTNIYPGYEVGTAHGFMHDRLADVTVNGVTLISKGVITNSTPNNLRTAAPSGIGTQYGRPETKNTFTISDWWTLADEHLLTRQPVGDGMKLGAYLRRLLLMAGWKTVEVSGVSAGDGITLPTANLGESPCVQPSYAESLGDFLRSQIEKYAMGWMLTSYNGVWTFAPESTDVKAVFSKNASYADRFAPSPVNRIFNQLDLPRDFGDSYNVFTVLGAKDQNGNQLSSVWEIRESFNYPPSPCYIGRVKAYPPVVDEGLRTQSMCDLVVRSLAKAHGRPGRFCEFTSWWIDGLHPKDRVIVDGVTWTIVRITSGSTKADRMSFACQEVV